MFDEAGGGGAVMQTETQDLHLAAVRCNNTAAELNSKVEGLMGRLEVMRDALVGLTGNEFQRLKEDVAAQMRVLNRALDGIGQNVNFAEMRYGQGDEDAQGILRQVDADSSGIESALGGLAGGATR